jgi:hypothetical protein
MVWWGKYVLYYPGQVKIPDSDIEEVFLEFQNWNTRGETEWRRSGACTPRQLCTRLSADQVHKDASRVKEVAR